MHLPAQVITLAQAVDQALKSGYSPAQIEANLAAAKAVNNLAGAKNSFSITTTVGYGASLSYNSPNANNSSAPANSALYGAVSNPSGTVIPTASVGSLSGNGVVLQNPTASVVLGTPMTAVTVGLGTGIQSYADGTLRNVGIASAKLSQTIWNGYRGGPTQAASDKADIAYQVAKLGYQSSRNSAILAVKQAYFNMLTAQENLVLLQATLDSVKKTLQITQNKFDQQTETGVDLLTAQVGVQNAELNLKNGENLLATARQRLANLMGLPADSPFQIASEPDPTTPAKTLAEAIALGMENRPEPQIAGFNIQSAQIDLDLALGSQYPSVTVSGGITDYLDTTYNGRNTLVGQVGLSLGAPLWDAGATNSSKTQAEQTKAAYQAQLRQLQLTIPVDIQEAWNAWQLDLQRLSVAADNKKAFNQQLEIVRIQFQSGAKALSDLLIAQTNASNADFGLLQAKINTQLAALQLQNLLGL